MADPNLKDFYGRVYKIRKSHRRGGGFEAAGTLGRAYFVPRQGKAFPIMAVVKPLGYVVAAMIVLKALIMNQIGPDAYLQHIQTLFSGDTFDKVGAVLMMPDPVSSFLTSLLAMAHL